MAERRRLALAETVRVHDADEIIQLVNTRERRGFPDGALGDFAVAHQDIGVVIQFILTRGERHADADAESLTERTRRHIGEREARRGMTFEVVAELAEFREFADGDKTIFRPRGVKQRRGVAFGKNEAVVVVKMRILRVILHVAEEERGDEVGCRAARSRMAAARRRRGSNRVDAQLVGDAFQQFNVRFNHNKLRSLIDGRRKPRMKSYGGGSAWPGSEQAGSSAAALRE